MKEWKGYQHGINLGGWLSQCDHTKERYDNFIGKEDFKIISEWGLDHVRIPIDYELIEDKSGKVLADGYKYIDNAIDWCHEYGLNMILDLHKTYGFSFDDGEHEEGFFENGEYQERFYRLWERLAERYGKFGERVAFEMLNEVTDKEYAQEWNKIAKNCIECIRRFAPEVKILVGGYWNNSIDALPDLDPPYDENIIYNFHCYEPLIFTHQGAGWISTMDLDFRMTIDEPFEKYKEETDRNISQKSIGFEGFDPKGHLGVDYFEKYFAEAVNLAEKRNVCLYCGEYGVIDLATPEDTVKWYEYISEVFNKYNIGRAAWTYRAMDFGIADEHMAAVKDEIIKKL